MEGQTHDIAAMRSRAANLRSGADQVRALNERLDRRIDGLAFEGPAAMRFRAASSERSLKARRAAERLDELAERLHGEASRLEQHGTTGAHGA